MGVFENGGFPRPDFQYPAPWNPEPTHRLRLAAPDVGCECDSGAGTPGPTTSNATASATTSPSLTTGESYRFTWEDFRQRPHLVDCPTSERHSQRKTLPNSGLVSALYTTANPGFAKCPPTTPLRGRRRSHRGCFSTAAFGPCPRTHNGPSGTGFGCRARRRCSFLPRERSRRGRGH